MQSCPWHLQTCLCPLETARPVNMLQLIGFVSQPTPILQPGSNPSYPFGQQSSTTASITARASQPRVKRKTCNFDVDVIACLQRSDPESLQELLC